MRRRSIVQKRRERISYTASECFAIIFPNLYHKYALFLSVGVPSCRGDGSYQCHMSLVVGNPGQTRVDKLVQKHNLRTDFRLRVLLNAHLVLILSSKCHPHITLKALTELMTLSYPASNRAHALLGQNVLVSRRQ